jgi:DNA polymerase lambda
MNIKAFKGPITDANQMKDIPFVGKAIIEKSAQFISEGKINKLTMLASDNKIKTLEILGGIFGVGPKGAEKLYLKGIRSIADLRKRQSLLDNRQTVGLKYYEEFLERMPRSEAGTIADWVTNSAKQLFAPAEITCLAAGSYRRNKPTCGDVDILITRSDNGSTAGMLDILLRQLTREGLLREQLAATTIHEKGKQMYMGVCIVDKIHRRIDIKVYPKD